jgi:PAS domain-containing protein
MGTRGGESQWCNRLPEIVMTSVAGFCISRGIMNRNNMRNFERQGIAPVTYREGKKSGEYAWLETLTESKLDEAGEVIRLLRASLRDISDRKHTEEALRQSERQFRAIFEQTSVGVAQVGSDEGWIRFNDRICEILGYTRKELPTVDFRDILVLQELERDVERGARIAVRGC